MNTYIALIRMNLRLALREKAVLFFNYVLPLIFFFTFGQASRADASSITQVMSMVLVIGILGSGLFGAGIRAVVERETNILRRYKVAPITPLPLQVASMVTGMLLYLPSVFILLGLSIALYHMPAPSNPLSLLAFICIGAVAFRSIGLIVAAVVNSAAESNIVVQLLWLPMLFLSGATFPISLFPNWLQKLSQFVPSSHLVTGLRGILLSGESIFANAGSVATLIATTLVATLLSVKLFRWEKDEKLPGTAKLWLLVVFVPFLFLGAYQAYSNESLDKTKLLDLTLRRNHVRLIRNARIFIGDGKVIESGSVLIRNGKIDQVFEGPGPDEKSQKLDVLDASGKTLLPGLIDVHVHLGAPGGVYASAEDYIAPNRMERELSSYLFSGIVAVRSVGDELDKSLALRTRIARGLWTGAELYVCGPMFTAPGGHGTEYGKMLPENLRAEFDKQMTRVPKTPEEAKKDVQDLKAAGVDGIKAILESGAAGRVFNRFDVNLLRAVGEQAQASGLPLAVHTGESHDVADALTAHPASIEHGSLRDAIPDALFTEMVKQGVAYDATLTVVEAINALRDGKTDLLSRSLIQQVGPAKLLATTKKAVEGSGLAEMRQQFANYPLSMDTGADNLRRAYKAGVMLVTGSDAGNMLVIHGPTIHRELLLYVKAGIPNAVALQAATYNAAKLLRADKHMGTIKPGMDASLLLVDGNPLQDIQAVEHISEVFLKGERIDRSDLFDQK